MPRGAAVVYPKDAAQIVAMADIFPGARVVEAGAGSGALTCWLLRAIGEDGLLSSYERRADFAEIARAQRASVLRRPAPGLAADRRRPRRTRLAGEPTSTGSCSTCSRPGTARRGAAALRARRRHLLLRRHHHAAVPHRRGPARARRLHRAAAWETMVRGWHVEGLAVRPDHRMIGHTGLPGHRAAAGRRGDAAAAAAAPGQGRRRLRSGDRQARLSRAGALEGALTGGSRPPARPQTRAGTMTRSV